LKKIIFYSYLKCSTCRKAEKWLKSKDFEYQLIDIVKEPPLVNYLNLALKQYSDDKKRIFNTRGKAFKILNLDPKKKYSKDEILSSYKKIMKKIHPDISPELTRLASIVNEAKDVVLRNI